ncbi:L-aspartate oxidase [Rosistilla carotiformis]|uniref:L-aspartate oxidase n=1 Tax=Rosistilla carotiformis TaxID=2528017 RepID=A0A518JZF8_9BACT|nr:L-aspartate oxidase [Rosistilla carotiformis]QDV70937.1 L-aspartate oxidase [Rosistilla carotiformis]
MTPRYLVAFHPKRALHRFTDLLVIGGGLSGLRAANAAAANQSVLVVTKDRIQESNSNYAQGGIAGVIDETDSFENHVQDTLNAGGNLCDRSVVDTVIREAPRRIEELIAWGTRFDSHQEGSLMLGREGGHSHQRIVHALGDATGREVMRAVIQRTRERQNIQIMENAFTMDLLTHEGRCHGAVLGVGTDKPTLVWAKQTILCTGGCGQIFRESTNPPVATADGIAAAYRAGVELRDMEMMQFHPTVLYIAGSSRFLITEAVRGEGAHLVDASGHRFMSEYDPRGELAPRDVVSQSIVRQMSKTQHPCVYLDLNHLDPKEVKSRFPGIAKVCQEFGLDITQDRIPVRPGAHYMIGGVSVDIEGRTSLPGLWAAGEVTSSGLHGANRLASNSLLEGLVYGAHAGEGAARAAAEMPDRYEALKIEGPATAAPVEPLDIGDIRNAMKSLMGRLCGVQRDAPSLRQALDSLESYCSYALPRQFDSVEGWELQNMLLTARLMAATALAREESRGVHFRNDFPTTNDEQWRRHLTVQIDRDGGRPRQTPIL